MGVHAWEDALDMFYDAHEGLDTDMDARSAKYVLIDDTRERSGHVWHVRQILADWEGDHDWAIDAYVDLDATQEGADVVFADYRVGSVEQLGPFETTAD